MSDDRKKPGVAFWATVVVVVVLVGYPLSFGPACWAVSHADLSENLVNIPYRPILSLHQHGPRWLRRWIHHYSLSTSAHGWGLRTVIYLDTSEGPDGEDVELTEWRRLAR